MQSNESYHMISTTASKIKLRMGFAISAISLRSCQVEQVKVNQILPSVARIYG